jgi:NADH-quinone oxidoreductase subunit M
VFYSTFRTIPLLFIVVEDRVLNSSLPFIEWTYLPYVSLVIIRIGFFIKLPLFLFHIWLPKVHVESPTSSRILLARLILKIGGYGLIRLLPSYSWIFCGFIISLTLFSIIFCSILCIFLRDLKRFVAYSSIVHIGFFLITLLQDRILSKSARLFLIVSHGILSSVIFYFAGELFYIFNTRIIYFIKGLRARSLVFSQFFILSLLANSSIPIFLGFYGEVLRLRVIFRVRPWLIIFLIIYFIISLYYNLWLICAALSGNFMRFIRPLCLQIVLPLLFLNIFFIILI